MQRKFERTIRKQKRRVLTAEASGDKEALSVAQTRLKRVEFEYRRFSKTAGLRTENERLHTAGFGRSQATSAIAATKAKHTKWLKSIGAQNTELNTLEKYYEGKYNNTPEYRLLSGYNRAVGKGDVSPLVGFDEYKRTSNVLQTRVVGITTSTGLKIESFTTHFIDRVIGQTSTDHDGMRCGVSVDDVIEALLNPTKPNSSRVTADGDVRETFRGEKCAVTVSVRDKRLIKPIPEGGKHMLKMTAASRAFLEKYLPAVLDAEKVNDALDPLYDLIDEKGFAPPQYEDYNDFGREAQKVYDDLYLSNK